MPEQAIEIAELYEVIQTWVDRDIEDLGYELPCGKIATNLFVTNEHLEFRTCEKFGEGYTPYADNPDKHREYLESEDVVETDDVVVYDFGDGSIELPQWVYFEERVELENPITATTPLELATHLENELNALDAIHCEVTVTPPSDL